MSPRVRQCMLLGLSTVLGTSSCQMTLTELKALNPSAATLEVSCRPSEIPDNVKVMALQSESRHIVTDENQDELMNFARLASVFIEFKDTAPEENAQVMESDYGLSCPIEARRSELPSESLPDSPRLNARFLGQTANTSAQTTTSSGTTSLPRIGICARPPGIAGNVNEWHGGPGIKGTSTTDDAANYAKQTAKATVLFYYDAKAPPESVWNLGKDTKVRCPGGAPIPYDQWVAKNPGTAGQSSGSTNAATPSASTTTTTTTTTKPKKGDEKTTSTSSPDGQGPKLTFLEEVTRQMSIAGRLATGDVSAPLTVANGSRHGMPGGKNVGGFSFPPLQAGVAIIQIVSAVGLNPKKFVEKVAELARRGQRTFIKEADANALKLADDLIHDYSQYEMAKGLQEMQTIMPFELGQKFTANLGGKFQAHKIFERRAIKKFMAEQNPTLSKEALEKAVDELAKKYPAIILTEAEHTVISTKLAAAWKGKENSMTKQKLREVYKEVYKDFPHWLEAIESYLR